MRRGPALVVALVLAASGCSGDSDDASPPPAPAVTEIGGVEVELPGSPRSTTTFTEKVDRSRSRSLLDELQAQQTKEGVEVNLPSDVFFDFGSAALRPDAAAGLDAVVGAAKTYPNAVIRLTGHTDDVGEEAANLRLSEQRATAVAAGLTAKDPALAARIQVVGRGEAEPVAPNRRPDGADDPAGRQRNRRVAILFVGARL